MIGKVLSSDNSPNLLEFEFVVTGDVKAGEAVGVDTEEGVVVGRVEGILATNRMLSSAEAVKDGVDGVDEWNVMKARVRVLGLLSSGISRPSKPVRPGMAVRKLERQEMERFFGIGGELNIGKAIGSEIDVRLDIDRLLQKHVAVLAMSGAGKSHFIKVLLWEMLHAKGPAVIVFDIHGEYREMVDIPEISSRVRVINGKDVRISTKHLIYMQSFFSLTDKERKSLRKILSEKVGDTFSLDEIEHPLAEMLKPLGLFAEADYPSARSFKTGHLYIIDMSGILENMKRQLIVYHVANQLFRARVNGEAPPFLLVLEEAHNYAPERATKEMGFAKRIIETISREGRKFGACICLVSQRPFYMSTTALSQCNTKIIFRMTNPADVKHVEQSSEALSADTAKLITTLRTGEAIIVGEALNFPLLVKIKGLPWKSEKSKGLKEMIEEWERQKDDIEAFL